MHTVQPRLLTCLASLALACAFVASPMAQARPRKKPTVRKPPAKTAPPPLPCGDYVGFQVLLDREGFSPGEIDGRPGANFSHALTALQQARRVPTTGQPDCDTWHALGGNTGDPTLTSYTITDEDVQGPFVKLIPRDLDRQAELPSLGYMSVAEKLGERFHVAPLELARLNPGVTLGAGVAINVPAVVPFDPTAKPRARPDASGISLQVSKDDSSVRAIGADGTPRLFAPVTTGSEHDPLPQGTWTVTEVDWMPVFHYNPALFWDAKPDQSRATLKPGPNNPVGVAWIGLTLEHYGLHGTPEPGHIGHTESHGCVRMTNWDAARLATLVVKGTPVVFR